MYEFVDDLCESQLIRTKGTIKKYSIKDIADLTFLYFLVLEIFNHEEDYRSFNKKYATKTLMHNGFRNFKFNSNDMYVLIYSLLTKDGSLFKGKQEANNDVFGDFTISEQLIKRYFTYMKHGHVPQSFSKRFLIKLQNDLNITTGNYKSMRVLVCEWSKLDDMKKKLVVTRLLQAFRVRAVRSELMKPLTKYAKAEKLELDNVVNPENNKVEKPEKGKFPWWMAGAALAGGTYAGYKMGKDK